MYLSEGPIGQNNPKRRLYAPFLGESPFSLLYPGDLDYKRAAELNEYYAKKLGWGAQFNRLVRFFGFPYESPAAINFAQRIAGWQSAQPGLSVDGVIGPKSWSRLKDQLKVKEEHPSEPAAVGLINTPLPPSGEGYYPYVRTGRQFGIPQTIQAIQLIGRAWNTVHPRGPRLGIGDISLEGGGPMPPHRAHQRGVDVDIRPVRNDGLEGTVTIDMENYSRPLTRELVIMARFNNILPVDFILFNDPGVVGVKPYPDHDNHLHIRFHLRGAG
jgi:hypothetical protein